MNSGHTLSDIAQELERQTTSRKDYLVPQGAIDVKVIEGKVVLDGINGAPVTIQPHAHGQIATHLGIPKAYYDTMQAKQPELLAQNIRTWLHADQGEKRMIRTLDGQARAFLSPKFRPLDNYELANAVLPTLLGSKVQVLSAELTETRMYLKGILPDLSDTLPDGLAWGQGHHRVDGLIVAAVTISNSEVGAGSLRVEPSVFTPWCTNLAALASSAMKKYHVGRSFSLDESGYEVFRDETRRLDDRAFFAKVQDITRAAFDVDAFKRAVADLKATVDRGIKGNLTKVVDITVQELALPKTTAGLILEHLARGGDLSQWGLASAITRTANDEADYETATLLEHAGGKVLALPPAQWERLAEAA